MAGRTVAWFHCFAGIAGDMALGALLDAGAPVDEVRGILGRLPVDGWALEPEPVTRNGIAGTLAVVKADEGSVVRTYAGIRALLEDAALPPRVATRALAAFAALAEAEATLHRREISQVHFHEVGGLDAIVDIVGTAAALELLGVDDVRASSVATGTGMIRAAHGLLPNPPPAVVELLASVEAPTYGIDVSVELTTPTGAALLASLVSGWGPLPPMTVRASGFGAGSRELDDLPNLTQVVVGTTAEELADHGQPAVLLETNVDDATGETLAHAVAALLAAGAHDAWVTPILMKKGRPAHTVSVLADPAVVGTLAEVLRQETGTLGVRRMAVERWPAARQQDEVEVLGHPVRIKVSRARVKVEHDDAAAVAEATGVPLREVVSLAEEAARRRP